MPQEDMILIMLRDLKDDFKSFRTDLDTLKEEIYRMKGNETEHGDCVLKNMDYKSSIQFVVEHKESLSEIVKKHNELNIDKKNIRKSIMTEIGKWLFAVIVVLAGSKLFSMLGSFLKIK